MKGAVVVDPTYHSILCRVCRQRGAMGEVVGRRTVQIARFSWRRVNRGLHSLSSFLPPTSVRADVDLYFAD